MHIPLFQAALCWWPAPQCSWDCEDDRGDSDYSDELYGGDACAGPPRRLSAREEAELEQRMMNCGFTDDEAYELACQGVKPWDDDAWDGEGGSGCMDAACWVLVTTRVQCVHPQLRLSPCRYRGQTQFSCLPCAVLAVLNDY